MVRRSGQVASNFVSLPAMGWRAAPCTCRRPIPRSSIKSAFERNQLGNNHELWAGPCRKDASGREQSASNVHETLILPTPPMFSNFDQSATERWQTPVGRFFCLTERLHEISQNFLGLQSARTTCSVADDSGSASRSGNERRKHSVSEL